MKYKPKMKPRDYQNKALKKAEGKEAFGFMMAMRTGKTKVALDEFGIGELGKEYKDQLVIAPGGVYKTWEKAINDHCSEDLLERMKVFTFRSGMGKKEQAKLAHFLQLDPSIPRTLLMNVEALSRDGDGRKLLIHFLKQRPKVNRCVIDESTVIKNKSKRTQFINKNVPSLTRNRRILSGLPTPRSPLDYYYQFEFLDPDILGFNNYYSFRARVAIMKEIDIGRPRPVPIVVGYREEVVEQLKEWVEPFTFRVPFRPQIPSTFESWEVELTIEQEKAYREMEEFSTTFLEGKGHVTATVVIAQIQKLHGILCGHVKDEDGKERFIKEKRTDAVLDILEEYSGKAVVWCCYDADVKKVSEALTKEYGEGSVARFWGGNRNTREIEEKIYLQSPECRFMVATQSAGGRGRTWDVADLAIYHSSLNNLEHREQSEQRTMGTDKERRVDNIDIVAPGTVDMAILKALRDKIDMATIINGDNYKEWLL